MNKMRKLKCVQVKILNKVDYMKGVEQPLLQGPTVITPFIIQGLEEVTHSCVKILKLTSLC